MDSTKDVLDRHLQCFGAGNLDGIVADYEPSAAMLVPTGVVKGTDAIRAYFRGMFAEFSKPGMSFGMDHLLVEGECAYIVWHAETADNVYEMGTDTFYIRNGKIASQTYAAKITPKK